MAKKNYVIDTSVYLTDAEAVFKLENNDIFVPLKVLEEVDKHKKRQDSVGINARKFIRILDELRTKGCLQKGVRIDKGKGILKVQTYLDIEEETLPPDLDRKTPDHIIIATALTIKKNSNRKTVIISRDINMRVIADSLGLLSQDYTTEKVVTSSDELYAGFCTHLVDDQIIDRFYDDEQITISEDDVKAEWQKI